MPLLNDLSLRSDEIQDVIHQTPSWIIRWGITIKLILVLLLLGTACFVHYPQVLKARFVLTTRETLSKQAYHHLSDSHSRNDISNHFRYVISGKLAEAGSGRIRSGQLVTLKFDAYPYQDFGTWTGHVQAISSTSDSGFITLHIIADGKKHFSLHTVRNHLQGDAEIMINTKSILEKLFDLKE
ncbi:hypothetical protein QNI16_34240 [Cytophagaceae bacterium YF14B1]|uniref:Uncharacterized protein n=1 Tax=Xanthocytophaga flava TaxID=3048013 RepID=A0AAE3QV65_9BACT|nr:hypothetical protein [Xanthocytophaga flavus]MDJ1485601.1 hypothetical protein [Xanthocytophaga flavus]